MTLSIAIAVIAVIGWATAFATERWALAEQARAEQERTRADKAEDLALAEARLIRVLKSADAEKDAALRAVLQWDAEVADLQRLSAMPANACADRKYWRTH